MCKGPGPLSPEHTRAHPEGRKPPEVENGGSGSPDPTSVLTQLPLGSEELKGEQESSVGCSWAANGQETLMRRECVCHGLFSIWPTPGLAPAL